MRSRVAMIDDVPAIADLMTAVNPDDPWDPVLWRHRWEGWAMTGFPMCSHVFEDGGVLLAFAEWWFHPPPADGPRFGSLRLATREHDVALFRSALELLESEVRELEVEGFACWLPEGDRFRAGQLEAAGYRRDRQDRVWELDLVAARERLERMAEAARERLRTQGVEVTTLDRAAASDPGLLRKLYEVDCLAVQDIPTTVPHVPLPFDAWRHELGSPGLHWDRIWIALQDGEVLGMSWLKYPPARGHVSTDWTGVAPTARGRGIARALKLETLLQAIGLGVTHVRTDNDEANAPILHLNRELGYRAIPGRQLWLKTA